VGQVCDLPVLCCVGIVALAATALAEQRNFVSCPIVRDTKTVPCFLAEYNGELYYLGAQQDPANEFHAPQLKHEVLVEGSVAEGPRVCGGIPLQPVAISVLKEVNQSCNTLLPPEPGMDAPPASPRPAPSARTSRAGEFTVLYAFDEDDPEYPANLVVTEASAYAKRVGATKIRVAGYRATTLLSNGDHLVEQPGIAEKRAQNIATLLRGLGVPGVLVEWKTEPEPDDGLTDPSRRRVTILITP
jgi:outer membrane protein OmpA-like peptidoglycan-associated protein